MVILAPVPAAPWHFPVAGYRWRSTGKEEVQGLSDWLLSLRGPSVHIDIAEVRTKEGKLYLFVAIHRTSKFAIVRLDEQADRPTAVLFLEAVLQAVPYPNSTGTCFFLFTVRLKTSGRA